MRTILKSAVFLLSAALLFGGLAVTVVTIKNEEDYYEQD